MTRPVIGITGRRLLGAAIPRMDPRYQSLDIDVYFSDYARGLASAGALPVLLPYEVSAEHVMARLDGVLITGGQDLHPASWGGAAHIDAMLMGDRTKTSAYDSERDDYEITLIRAALANDVPLLGVCRGHQALNVALGGTLIADLGHDGVIQHYQPDAAPHRGQPEHTVDLHPDTLAAAVLGTQVTRNSWHHQSVADCGAGLVVSGRTQDGVIEVIEIPGKPVLGVQWHPEWQIDPDPVINWLIDAATARARRRYADTDIADRSTATV